MNLAPAGRRPSTVARAIGASALSVAAALIFARPAEAITLQRHRSAAAVATLSLIPVADPAPQRPPVSPAKAAAPASSGPVLAVIPGVPAPPKGRRAATEAIVPPTLGPPPSPRGPLPLETELLPMTPTTAGGPSRTPPPPAGSRGP